MSEPVNRASTPTSVTGRRRRFTGANPYPALPRSRLPLLRGVLWVTWAGFLALLDGLHGLIPGVRRRTVRPVAESTVEPDSDGRPPRLPSLTPSA